MACAVFFTRDGVALEEALDCSESEDQPLLAQSGADLLDGSVALRTERFEDRFLVSINMMGLLVTAHRPGPGIPLFALTGLPATNA